MKSPIAKLRATSLALLLVSLPLVSGTAHAQAAESASSQPMVEDTDGEIGPNEYRTISENGGLTRRPCPYTCEMRGIPREHCKEWPSVSNPEECYVEDTRLASSAMPAHERAEPQQHGAPPRK